MVSGTSFLADYVYDGVYRIEESRRGANGGTFSYAPASSRYTASEAWELDFLGNWEDQTLDTGGDGLSVNTTVTLRTHSDSNEILTEGAGSFTHDVNVSVP